MGVGRGPVAHQLGDDRRPARLGALPLLEDYDGVPSPITKPSRSLSNGRLAVLGSSLRSDNAFMFAKLASASGVIAASDPPATITSALFSRIKSNASPTAWPDDAHAETVQ